MKNEIKEIISDGFKSAFGGIIANEGIDHASGIIATALHKKGYRKQEDTVNEFAEKIVKKFGKSCSEYYPEFIEMTSMELYYLAEQYGKEE